MTALCQTLLPVLPPQATHRPNPLRRLLWTLVVTGLAWLGAASPAFAQTAASAAASTPSTAVGASQPRVRLSTTLGDIVVQLDRDKAPKTVDNFLAYVRSGHYDGTIFHRVIGSFMIQGGGFKADMTEKPTRAPIALESRTGLTNQRGTIAMARTSAPNSATAQFFINVVDNSMLDQSSARDGNGYAVFGKVIDGMDVVDKIRAVSTRSAGMMQDVPVEPITIRKASLEK